MHTRNRVYIISRLLNVFNMEYNLYIKGMRF